MVAQNAAVPAGSTSGGGVIVTKVACRAIIRCRQRDRTARAT